MNFEQLLRQHPRVIFVKRAYTTGPFPTYHVRMREGGGAYVTQIPLKAFAKIAKSVQDPERSPWVLIAATRWHDPGLVRMRIDEGLAAAEYYHRNT